MLLLVSHDLQKKTRWEGTGKGCWPLVSSFKWSYCSSVVSPNQQVEDDIPIADMWANMLISSLDAVLSKSPVDSIITEIPFNRFSYAIEISYAAFGHAL